MDGIVMFLLPALAACLVLTGIHVYLGLHVLARGVIFVDIALAQVAALGAAVAVLLGHEPGTVSAWFVSLGFTFGGAVLFTLARGLGERVPTEAIIGIVYAVASGMAVIIADRLPHGAEEIRRILVGNLLTVTWPHIAATAAIYAVIGAVHYVWRDRFLQVSFDPEAAAAAGVNVPLWDFLFYATFGTVITSSVSMGGILVVFCYLVMPAAIVVLFARGIRARLLLGWAVGFVGSVLGLYASFTLDLPTGAAVVTTFGALLVVAAVIYGLLAWRPSWPRA